MVKRRLAGDKPRGSVSVDMTGMRTALNAIENTPTRTTRCLVW